ncbi:hypothetical protein O2K51_01855 [Apibacter raozihei]|uniref:hypothetical protein n=1 Tax=Apibacter raozihei TaxID=2500547 RepID=UPI000FE3B803|nr:hypothetical protein [Apibacter raozihei]
MNKNDVINLIGEKILPIIKNDGFKFRKAQYQFSKKGTDNFIFRINFVCLDFSPQYKIPFYIAIRNEKVEDIKNKFLELSPKSQQETSTLTLPISFFTEKNYIANPIEFWVEEENDIDKITNFFQPFYKKYIIDFFNQYSSLKKISDFMKDSIDKNEIFGDKFYFYFTSAILLKLSDDSEYLNRVEKYRELINDYPVFNREKYERLLDYLKSYE